MRIGVLANEQSWYWRDLHRAAVARSIECRRLEFPRLLTTVGIVEAVTVASSDQNLSDLDAIIVRTMPVGTLEQVVYRMDVLATLAALTGRTDLEILDRLRPRDHTERILRAMGAPVASEVLESGERIRFPGASWDRGLEPIDTEVPGDLLPAAFLVAAALLTDSQITILNLGANPTRAGFVRVLAG